MSERASWRLGAEVFLWRRGWGVPVAIVLVLALAVTEATWIRSMKVETRETRARLDRVASDPVARPGAASGGARLATSLDEWTASLPPTPEIAALLDDVYAQGRLQGVRIRSADYQYARDERTGLVRASLGLGVTGSYGAIRRLVEGLLRTHANLAVDALRMSRAPDNVREPDVRLQATAWFAAPPAGAAPPELAPTTETPGRPGR